MAYLYCALMGYGLGCISPSLLLSIITKEDLAHTGTKNLGATNSFMHFGFIVGFSVLAFDMEKAYFAVWLCDRIFPSVAYSGLVAGAMATIGHMLPFYRRFRGGKGMACAGGVILATDVNMFAFLVLSGVTMMFIINVGCALPIYVSVVYPVLLWIHTGSIIAVSVVAVVAFVVVYKHVDNIKKIRRGEESRVRQMVVAWVTKTNH